MFPGWDPHQKFNQEKLEMVQRRAARFVKSRYKRTDNVTAMLDELGWPILSKRRKDARLILFYKIINNLVQVPHEHILIKAYEGTRKKNNHKFRHIAVNTSQYRQSFFPKTVGPWNQLSFTDSRTLENFRINLMSTNRPKLALCSIGSPAKYQPEPEPEPEHDHMLKFLWRGEARPQKSTLPPMEKKSSTRTKQLS